MYLIQFCIQIILGTSSINRQIYNLYIDLGLSGEEAKKFTRDFRELRVEINR